MNQTEVSPERIAEWRKLRGKGMISAVGEYTPDDFWLLLDSFECLELALAKANADKAVLVGALQEIGQLNLAAGYECENLSCAARVARTALARVQA